MLNNLHISLEGSWNYIFTHVSIKILYKIIFIISITVHKSMEHCLFRDKYFFSSCVFFSKCWKRLLVKRLLEKTKIKTTFNSALATNQTYGEDFIFENIFTRSSWLFQFEAYYILLHAKLRINSTLAEKFTGTKSTFPTVLYLSVLFHNDNSIIINKLKKWIIILAWFRNGNISYTSLEC